MSHAAEYASRHYATLRRLPNSGRRKLDFEAADRAPEDELRRFLSYVAKGDVPYPTRIHRGVYAVINRAGESKFRIPGLLLRFN